MPTACVYLLRRPDDDIDTGEYAGHVIVARDADRALEIILTSAETSVLRMDGVLSTAPLYLHEGPTAWKRAITTRLGPAEDPTERVACSDYSGDV